MSYHPEKFHPLPEDPEAKKSPEAIATLRVHAKIDALIDKAREEGSIREGNDSAAIQITDIEQGVSHFISRSKLANSPVWGEVIRNQKDLPGTVYTIFRSKVQAGGRDLTADETSWFADDLDKL